MKILRILGITIFAAVLSTAVLAGHVTVNYDHATNFGHVKTYSWSASYKLPTPSGMDA